LGRSAEEIADQYGTLHLAQVHAALAYYYANRDAIDSQLAQEDEDYDRLSSASHSENSDVR
jgi:hypothetical protein